MDEVHPTPPVPSPLTLTCLALNLTSTASLIFCASVKHSPCKRASVTPYVM